MMRKCEQCIYYPKCEEYPFDESGCDDFKDKSVFVEVVHGHWVSLTECSNAGVYCSVCNKKVYKEDYAWCNRKNKLRSNYCPNCGATMDEEVVEY